MSATFAQVEETKRQLQQFRSEFHQYVRGELSKEFDALAEGDNVAIRKTLDHLESVGKLTADEKKMLAARILATRMAEGNKLRAEANLPPLTSSAPQPEGTKPF